MITKALTLLTFIFSLTNLVAQNNELLLVNFTGSDWCLNCIRQDNAVFSKDSFTQLIGTSIDYYQADFPRKKKNLPSPAIQKSNDSLATLYNTNGVFPKVVLINKGGAVIEAWDGYTFKSVASFKKEIQKHLPPKTKLYKHQFMAMGSPFYLNFRCANEQIAKNAFSTAEQEVLSIDSLISSWISGSETYKLNALAGENSITVDSEYLNLILRCNLISTLTNGAFDITYGSGSMALWHFNGSEYANSEQKPVVDTVPTCSWRNILIDTARQQVMLDRKGMRISFGGIGKGYAAERVKEKLLQLGITSGVVNAAGDVVCWGDNNGLPWQIAIADPNQAKLPWANLVIDNQAIATSGNYEQYVDIDGERWSHIINPTSRIPATGIKSVTVIAPNGELADALATGLFVLGVQKAIDLVNQIPMVECLIIDDNDRIFKSQNLLLD